MVNSRQAVSQVSTLAANNSKKMGFDKVIWFYIFEPLILSPPSKIYDLNPTLILCHEYHQRGCVTLSPPQFPLEITA